MLVYTFEQAKIVLIAGLIFSIMYLILYKGKKQSVGGYVSAIRNCVTYLICGIFAIVGCGLTIKIIEQRTAYMGLLISVTWYMLCLYLIKRAIQKDFGIDIDEIKIIKYIFIPYKFILYVIEHLSFIGKHGGIILGGIMWFLAYTCRENIVQAISLVLVGIIFGIIYRFTVGIVFDIEDFMNKKEEDE